MRWLGALVALSLAVALTAPCLARAEERRIVVEDFEGPGGSSVRASVLRSLTRVRDVVVVPRSDADESAGRLGVARIRPGDYVAIARDLSVSAFVSGRVEWGRGLRVTVQIRDGASGEIVGETRFAARRARRLSTAIRRGLWRRVGSAVRRTGTPAVGVEPESMQALENEAPPPMDMSQDDVEQGRLAALDPELFPDAEARAEQDAVDDEVDALFDRSFVPRHSRLEAHIGLRGINRGLRYVDDRSGTVRPYDLPLGPELALGAEWYPGAHLTNGALAHLGLTVDFVQSIGLSSAGPNDTSYPTSDTYWSLGARARIPVGAGRISVSAAFAHHAFSVEAAHPRDESPDIASVAYDHGRFGVGTRIAMGDLSLVLDAAYLLVLAEGEIAEDHWFPRTTTHGAEAAVGFIYPLGDQFQIRGSIDGRLYLLDFHAREDDARVVAGAVDRFIGATAAFGWRMGP